MPIDAEWNNVHASMKAVQDLCEQWKEGAPSMFSAALQSARRLVTNDPAYMVDLPIEMRCDVMCAVH